jgi:hypothetical protein
MEMKGSKKRKARQLDEIDYIPILKPIPDPETAQKVAAAMRQTMENKRVLSYLLQRIKVSQMTPQEKLLTTDHRRHCCSAPADPNAWIQSHEYGAHRPRR